MNTHTHIRRGGKLLQNVYIYIYIKYTSALIYTCVCVRRSEGASASAEESGFHGARTRARARRAVDGSGSGRPSFVNVRNTGTRPVPPGPVAMDTRSARAARLCRRRRRRRRRSHVDSTPSRRRHLPATCRHLRRASGPRARAVSHARDARARAHTNTRTHTNGETRAHFVRFVLPPPLKVHRSRQGLDVTRRDLRRETRARRFRRMKKTIFFSPSPFIGRYFSLFFYPWSEAENWIFLHSHCSSLYSR